MTSKLGIIFIIASFLPWITMALVLPLLPLAITQKALLVTVLLATGEVLFWLGALLAGKEVAQRFKQYFRLGYLSKQLKKLQIKMIKLINRRK